MIVEAWAAQLSFIQEVWARVETKQVTLYNWEPRAAGTPAVAVNNFEQIQHQLSKLLGALSNSG